MTLRCSVDLLVTVVNSPHWHVCLPFHWPRAECPQRGHFYPAAHLDTGLPFTNTARPVYGRTERKRADGEDRLSLQTPRIHLPILGNLRRHQWFLGLRPPRRRAEAQREGPLVARNGPAARRRGWTGGDHHH